MEVIGQIVFDWSVLKEVIGFWINGDDWSDRSDWFLC